jgi:hypothetical protein
MIDLGKWFGEEHVVSQPLRPENLEAGPNSEED